ncbi:MAG TPA: hypothetical protein VFR90_12625 [Methylibium sp.]|uniref:hypothetical protein n=1 Tax=Methylibium sp. TaxID=2067992 RepID=UPI002DB648CD|nr:hypothetical protein [Methylibium sp.]HEU4459959.1 hypothetical protein [Methylibium sp.]
MTPSTAREALIVEAIGDIAGLLDRVEAMGVGIDASRKACAEASAQLSAAIEALEGRMVAVSDTARTQVVQHIVKRTEEASRRAQEVQSRALAEAAREVFRVEVERSLQRLATAVQTASSRTSSAWEPWLTHAATAVTASIATWTLMTWSQGR